MDINSKDGLIKHLEETDSKKLKKLKPSFERQEFAIIKRTFVGYSFTKEFAGLEFISCKFINCKFENIWAFFMILKKCKFEKCEFRNSRFTHLDYSWDEIEFSNCSFSNVRWDEGGLIDILFDNCYFQSFSMLGFYPLAYVRFLKCKIENSQFQSLIDEYKDMSEIDEEFIDLLFENCNIEFSYFNGVDLRNSSFLDTDIYRSSFLDCIFQANTITQTIVPKNRSYASIDFQSIIKSDGFDYSILREYFNIYEHDIKNVVKNVTSKIDFKSVFISFSFKDKDFANLLNEKLNSHGIKTFLWEKDAPGGQALEDIMSINIRRHDKVLFIASANSIRSKACQYELSEGRKKQEATWENIFFPIHIDDYLFSVKKGQIRPISIANEYWENIEELRRINSMDFIRFNASKFEANEFDASVQKIIKELKL